jgi:hypothetical protein
MRGSAIGNGNRVSATLDLTGKDGSLSSLGWQASRELRLSQPCPGST